MWFFSNYLFQMGNILVILCGSFLYLHDLCDCYSVLKAFIFFYWRDLLFLFCFLSNQEILCMISVLQNLFYYIYNTINERISLPLTGVSNPIWYLERSDWKSSSIISSTLSFIMIFMSSLLECILRSLSLSLEEIKLIAVVNWIFHVQIFWDHSWCLLSRF